MKLRLIWKKLDEREHKCGSRWIRLSSSVGPTWSLLLWLVMRLWKKFITSCSRDKRYVRFTWNVANLTSRQTQKGKGDGILPGGRGRSTIFVDTSTVYPTTAGRIERLATSKPHRSFLSCPVFGVPRAAETADLILAISGDYFAKKHAAHALVPAIGKKVMDLGSNVERAMSFK